MAGGIYGISGSGMDVDAMVEKMMVAKKVPYNSLYQKKVRTEWKKESYLTNYSKISEYRNDVFSNYKLKSNWSNKTANVTSMGNGSSTSNNNVALKATVNADAANVTHEVEVSQLAQSASISSKSKMGLADDTDKKLSTILGSDLSGGLSIKFSDDKADAVYKTDEEKKAHTKTISYTAEALEGKTIYEFVNDINKTGLNLKASYDSNLDRLFIYNKTTGEEQQIRMNAVDEAGNQSALGANLIQKVVNADEHKIGFDKEGTKPLSKLLGGVTPTEDMNLKFNDGTTEIILKYTAAELSSKTIEDFVKDINDLGLDITAKYDVDSDRMYITHDTEGQEVQITAKDSSDIDSAMGEKILQGIKYGKAERTSATTEDGEFIAGKDAKVNIDGMELVQKTNSFTIAGVSYSLQDVGKVRVQVNTDIVNSVDTVKKFVESYNKMLESLQKTRDEVYYKDYPPLTDEEKAELSEDQIKKWEEKSKSGMLRNDATIKALINDMRNSVTNPVLGVPGNYKTLASLGIGSQNYTDGGKLYIDEAKLKKAIEADPDVLSNLFTASGSNSTEQGVANRIYDNMKTAMDKISETAGTPINVATDKDSALARQLIDYSKRLKEMETRLNKWEEQYYKQFNAMEVALGNLNNQMNFLTQASSS